MLLNMLYSNDLYYPLVFKRKPKIYVECKEKVLKGQIAYIDKQENFTINKTDSITKSPNLEIGVFIRTADYEELKIIEFNSLCY